MLDQREERERLVATLNQGRAGGWNDDEPAVVEAAANLILHRYYGSGDPDPEALGELVEIVSQALLADNRPSDVPKAEAVIRSDLGNDTDDGGEVARVDRFRLRAVVVGLASAKLELGEAEVNSVLRESEWAAFEHGFKPTLVPRPRSAPIEPD